MSSLTRANGPLQRLIVSLLLLLVPAAARPQDTVPNAPPAPQPVGVWQEVACPFDTTQALLPVRCGRLKVPENYWEPAGRSIEVAVMIVSAPNPTDLNPVIFLNGGPGSTSVWHAERLVATPAIREIVVDRDWVFFDHRGAGRSVPSMVCPPNDDWFRRVTSCRDQLMRDGVNLLQYNSVEISRDMEALRKALGVRQWNVWGASYGARLAFTFARYFPASTRTVLVDGPYLPEDQEVIEDLRGAEVVFNRILSKCAADAGCAAAYPHLRSRFYAALPRLRAQPLTVGETRIADNTVVSFLVNALYGGSGLTFEQSIQGVLAYMDAAARGDGERVQQIERQVARPARAPYPDQARSSLGLNLSLDCREEKAFESVEEYAQAVAGSEVVRSFFPQGELDGNFATCAWWPSGRANPIENTHVWYDGPILAFTGELDPTLSGLAGYKIEMLYANAQHVVFRNAGHVQFYIRIDDYSPEEYVYRRCALELARQFLTDPQRRLQDTRCAEARTVRLIP
ncbi:MAG TPA: alpha/beta fold hydrolase [Longimicrobium sp.]|nr:alpha/beta fold hydrolase [Longimicrobium sp.]